MRSFTEIEACEPITLLEGTFNPMAELPYGLETSHVRSAMNDFISFLGFVNSQLNTKQMKRLESMLMPANFSSIVGEFIVTAIPNHCSTLAKNRFHNGHPDLIPLGMFPGNATQHSPIGIEVKASRYPSGWQGHNPEEVWLMVFVFDGNRPSDTEPRPFRFVKVLASKLERNDWRFSGRSETSRRTITASVTETGYRKMTANWIYKGLDIA